MREKFLDFIITLWHTEHMIMLVTAVRRERNTEIKKRCERGSIKEEKVEQKQMDNAVE
jgi:hypothetical protein